MEEINEPSQQFIEGFNKGYVLREHKPTLALSLSQTKFPDSEKDFQTGFLNGIEQKEAELRKVKSKNFTFNKLRNKYKDELNLHDKSKDKDMDRE
ncbi:hypothetical protein [Kordia sp.]|uniref:hypothetical protein n=1 Tax=Kordia sp. TaxID=1965332 RepID=UPI003D6B627B